MKKSPENDRVRMQHMLDAALKVQYYAEGKSDTDLDNDELLGLGLIRLIEIIGEAATNVTDETRRLYPEIAWQDIADMRNHIIHGYFDIEYSIVWNTVH